MSMSSIGNDLASIREHKGYTIEDLQKATKIPLSTLKSIEDGSIFMNSDEITTYIRSFVRTYGRALKLDDTKVLRALDQEELSNYNNLLLDDFPEIKKKKGIAVEPSPESLGDDDDDDSSNKKIKKSPGWTFEGDEIEETQPKGSTSSDKKSIAPAQPSVRSVNWAAMGGALKSRREKPPVWLISAGFIMLLIITAAILISQFGLFSSDDVPSPAADQPGLEEQATGEDQDLALDLTEQVPAEQEPVAALSDTLYVTVYAAFSQLDPVRVWSDLKPRIDPYWLDQGVAMNFEFQNSVRIRGSYSNMLLFLNGNRIDNFRNQYFNEEENSVELTRDIFDSDPRWATPVPFELPANTAEPDTVMNRPSF